MQDNFENAIGIERFNNYIFPKSLSRRVTYQEAFNIYQTNIEICSLIYPIINTYEILLRNRIDKILVHKFEKNWVNNKILRGHIHKDMEDNFNKCKNDYFRKNKNAHIPETHYYISQLTLGVWTRFLKQKYFHLLGFNNGDLNFAKTYKEQFIFHRNAEKIGILRNRIAHHEAIYQLNLMEMIAFIYNFIQFVSPAHYQMLMVLNKRDDLTLCEQIELKQNNIQKLIKI